MQEYKNVSQEIISDFSQHVFWFANVYLAGAVRRCFSNRPPVMTVATKQIPNETMNAMCIPSIKISGWAGRYDVTLYPADWLIAEYSTVVATEIPTIMPNSRANALIPPATPKSLTATELITIELLGAMKIPLPNPTNPTNNKKNQSGVASPTTM